MAIIVTLDYFSGIANPTWTLSRRQAAELRTRFGVLRSRPKQLPQIFPGLGYKGMRVRATRGEVPDFTVRLGVIFPRERRRAPRADPGQALEAWILDETIPPEMLRRYGISFAVANLKRNERPIAGIGGAGPVGGLRCRSGPAFLGHVAPWTSRRPNNCYSYANNEPVRTWHIPVPGEPDIALFTDASIFAGATQDRLEIADPPDSLPAACPVDDDAHYLAICLREQRGTTRDFHCLRLDANGEWSHKDGPGEVRNTDDQGRRMTDLRSASFRDPLTLVGFFISTEGRRVIEH